MAKSDKHIRHDPNADITEQPYRGTNEVVSGLGYGAVETKAGLLAGVPVGAVVGAIAHKGVHKVQNTITSTLDGGINRLAGEAGKTRGALTETLTAIPRWTLRAAKWIVNVSEGTAKHAFESLEKASPKSREYITKLLGKEGGKRFAGAATGATLGALAGFVIASVTGAAHGAKVAGDGRKQFNDAKDEIRNLRKTNQHLEGQYNALRDSHQTVVDEISEIKSGQKNIAELPSTSIDAATVDAGKRREDQTLSTLPATQAL